MGWASDAAILTNYSEALKTFYLPAIQEQLNHDTILADIIDVNEEDVSGTDATIETHYGRTTGRGARKDAEALPEANRQKFKKMTVPMKYLYGRITVTGPTIAASRDERGAYARALDAEITGVVRDLQKEVNRMLWGCGYGVLARWRTTASGTSYTLQKKYCNNSAGGDGFGSTFGAKYFDEEMSDGVPVVLSSMASSSSADFTVDATDIAVSAITESNDYDTITCTDPSVTEAAGTFYVRPSTLATNSTASGAHRKEIMGLRGIVTNTDLDEIACNDGTNTGVKNNDALQGLAVASYSFWKAIVDAHSGGRYSAQRNLSLKLMQKVFDKVEIAAGKDYGPDLILTTHAIRREYLELCQADRRYVNEMQLDGGWTAIDYNRVPFTVDNDAIDGEIYFLTTKDLQMYRMSDYNWMQKDGSVLFRLTGYDAYEATLYRYCELGCQRRNAQGVLCDIAYEN